VVSTTTTVIVLSRECGVDPTNRRTYRRFPVEVNDGHGAWTEHWTVDRIRDYINRGATVREN
jgi:hypothetical protein